MSRFTLSVIFGFMMTLLMLSSSTYVFAPSESQVSTSPNIRAGASTSYVWAGYAVTSESGSVTDVKGSWVVPLVTSSTTDTYSSSWVGIDGYTSSTVEQIGTNSFCLKGVPTYYAWYEFYPKVSQRINSLTINPGDVISAEVSYQNGIFMVSITDITTNQQFSTSQKVSSAQRTSAEWIIESPHERGKPTQLADFGSTSFGYDYTLVDSTCYATISGTTGSISSFGSSVQQITMVDSSNLVLAKPSSLTADGASFSVQRIHMTDLGTLSVSIWPSEALSINNKVQVVGLSQTSSDPGYHHAFLWTAAGGMVDLGTLGGAYSSANSINGNGQVVGESSTASGYAHAFLWTAAGGMVDLGTLGGDYSLASCINSKGQVVGCSSTILAYTHAFLWTAAKGMVDLGTLGGVYSRAYGINTNGHVVGESTTTSGDTHAFLWTAAKGMKDLGILSGGTWSRASGINDKGQIVGTSSTSADFHAFLWTANGGMVDLGTLSGTMSDGSSVNNNGQVVGGSSVASGSTHAFLWTAAGGMVDLGTLGGSYSNAIYVNDNGQIVGASTTDSWETHPFLWNP